MWTVLNIADVLGPIFGGVLLAKFGAYSLLYLDSLSFLFSLVTVLLIMPPIAAATQWGRVHDWWQDMLKGFRMLWRTTLVRQLSLIAAAVNLSVGMLTAVLLFYLRDVLHTDAATTGLVYSAAGIGSLLGALLTAPLARRFARGKLVAWFMLLSTVGALLLALGQHWLAAGIGYGLFLGAIICTNIVTMAIRQQIIPGELLGRVISVHRMIAFAGIPLGSTLASASVEGIGATNVLLTSACTMLLAVFASGFKPLSSTH